MALCNIFTGGGFADIGVMGSFSMAWLGLAIIFFINAFARKWIGEEMGYSYSFLFGTAIGIAAYIIAITISCEPKWGLLLGIIGSLAGGFGAGMFGGEEYG